MARPCMNCAQSLSSWLGVWKMFLCMWPTRKMYVLKSPTSITLCRMEEFVFRMEVGFGVEVEFRVRYGIWMRPRVWVRAMF